MKITAKQPCLICGKTIFRIPMKISIKMKIWSYFISNKPIWYKQCKHCQSSAFIHADMNKFQDWRFAVRGLVTVNPDETYLFIYKVFYKNNIDNAHSQEMIVTSMKDYSWETIDCLMPAYKFINMKSFL